VRNGKAMTRSIRHRGSIAARLLVVVALVSGAIATFATPSGAAPTWSPTITASPSPFRAESLPFNAVACTGPSNCFSVGSRTHQNDSSTSAPVVQRWNGTTWAAVVNQEAFTAVLYGVACPSANRCFAVGSSGAKFSRPFVERWNGVDWSAIASPKPTGVPRVILRGVSCATVSNCFAVGTAGTASKSTPLIEHWNGRAWKIVPSPRPAGAVTASLNGVSCRTTTNCVAVGGHIDPGDDKGGVIAEHWNGKVWKIIATPTPKVRKVDALLGTPPRLNGVSCTTTKNCVGVGFTASDALVERWNGAKWSLVATPKPQELYAIAELRAVSCASANDCSAVGVSFLPIDQREGVEKNNSIIEHWNGKAWAIAPKAAGVPTTKAMNSAGGLSELNGVSCLVVKNCAAVGNSTMGERWDGRKWSLTPVVASTSHSSLNDVVCPGPTTCFAVGAAAARLELRDNTLIERWDGTKWSVSPTPTPNGINVHATLTSISCVSSTDCTAVGGYFLTPAPNSNGSYGNPLILHWDGTKWSNVANPSPTTVPHGGSLNSVSCFSASDCTAVGNYSTTNMVNGAFDHRLAEHWNGTSWSLVALPGPEEVFWNGATCASSTSCLAVGSTLPSGAATAATWNGTAWSAVASPAPPAGTYYSLSGVSCVTSSDCTAVGDSYTASSPTPAFQPLIQHWNGAAWSVVPGPTTFGGSHLEDVSCTTATDCTAVGVFANTRTFGRPLVEQWNGSSWTQVLISEADNTGGNFLSGVTCTSPSACTAVGYRVTSDGRLTLIQTSS
jgi:hypothetical protein